jgi:hypothetical protein
VKKLAKSAQTVFTESSWYRQHINGLADAKEVKINSKKTELLVTAHSYYERWFFF